MPYIRKTTDVFIIQGYYSSFYGWEDVCEYETRKEAKEDLKAYRENMREYSHRLIKKRVKKQL